MKDWSNRIYWVRMTKGYDEWMNEMMHELGGFIWFKFSLYYLNPKVDLVKDQVWSERVENIREIVSYPCISLYKEKNPEDTPNPF